MAATPFSEPPPLDDILDDTDPRTLLELLDKYKDATTAGEAGDRLNNFVKDNPDKFLLKLALLFQSSNNVETCLDLVVHLHNFLMRNWSCLKTESGNTIKEILLNKVKTEENDDILEYVCNIVSDVGSVATIWSELVDFLVESLKITSGKQDGNSVRNKKICLDIIAKQPIVIKNGTKLKKEHNKHEAISNGFSQLLSSSDRDMSGLALKATIRLVACLESQDRKPYKKLLPKFRSILQYLAKDPGPKAQRSVVGENQKLVDRYLDAANLIQTLVDMNDIDFFITEGKHLTNFIKCLLNIGGTKLCWIRMRQSILKLVAKFCKHQNIDMRSYYLQIYGILMNMLIEVEESPRWYEQQGDDMGGNGAEYQAAKSLLDEFIPAIGVGSFLIAVDHKMTEDMKSGEWRTKNGVMVVVTKLASFLNNVSFFIVLAL